MKLLFITHKIHELDDDFAFTSLWVQEFQRQGFEVDVICLEKGIHNNDFKVYSLGKENGASPWKSLFTFWKLITSLKYDRVFVHMNPKWVLAGAWYWALKGTPVYLWYTHYTTHLPLKTSHWLCKRLFCATKDSMPQYEGDPKKIVTGHGIDLSFWNMEVPARDLRKPKTDLLSVHRICRSKRPHLSVLALKFLPEEYNLCIYGRELEGDYAREFKELMKSLGLENRVKLAGPVPMPELRKIYPQYQIMLNMAMDTIDKTMVEGMMAGLEIVATPHNAAAIGLPHAPIAETPEAIAEYIKNLNLSPVEELQKIAQEGHSLSALVRKMGRYIQAGN